MSFNYTTGLNNMGSYQVSGRPWLKTVTGLADGATQYLEFTNVTKKVRVKNHTGSGKCLFGFCTNPGSGINFGASAGSHIDTTFSPKVTDFTISYWIDFTELGTGASNRARIIDLDTVNFGSNNGFSIHMHKNSDTEVEFRFFIDSSYVPAVTHTVDTVNKWHHVTVSGNSDGSGTNKVYIDGTLVSTKTGVTGGITGIELGDSTTAAYLGGYDQTTLWNSALTDQEVANIYNYGYADPRLSDLDVTTGTLVSWWAFENNLHKTFFATPDTTSVIYDRVGSNNFALGSGAYSFVDGFNLANVFNGGHVFSLETLQDIEVSCKTKSIVVRADGAAQDFDVYASLTNIPIERMYELTGPGIDE
jgi:hypothetical protein